MNRDRTRRALARERRILALEDRLARELGTVQSRLSDVARRVLPDTGQPLSQAAATAVLARIKAASKASRGTATATRRAARTAAMLVALGLRDGREMMAGPRAKFAVAADDFPKVSEADVATYHQLAQGVADKLAAEHYDALRKAIEEGLRAGETDRQIGRRIHQLDIGLSKAHAQSWAATESTRFYNLGTVTAGAESDALWGYEYWNPDDARTTPTCREYSGRRVAKADLKAIPPLHWRCRTRLFPIMQEEYTGEPVQPEGTELPPEAKPAKGFGADPRKGLPIIRE